MIFVHHHHFARHQLRARRICPLGFAPPSGTEHNFQQQTRPAHVPPATCYLRPVGGDTGHSISRSHSGTPTWPPVRSTNPALPTRPISRCRPVFFSASGCHNQSIEDVVLRAPRGTSSHATHKGGRDQTLHPSMLEISRVDAVFEARYAARVVRLADGCSAHFVRWRVTSRISRLALAVLFCQILAVFSRARSSAPLAWRLGLAMLHKQKILHRNRPGARLHPQSSVPGKRHLAVGVATAARSRIIRGNRMPAYFTSRFFRCQSVMRRGGGELRLQTAAPISTSRYAAAVSLFSVVFVRQGGARQPRHVFRRAQYRKNHRWLRAAAASFYCSRFLILIWRLRGS